MEGMTFEEPGVFAACKEDSHVDLHLDLLASRQLLGGKAASCLNYYNILVSWYLVSGLLTAPSREFYWRYKGTAAARRQPSCSVAGRWRLAWRCETWEEAVEAEEGSTFIMKRNVAWDIHMLWFCQLKEMWLYVHVREDGGKEYASKKRI